MKSSILLFLAVVLASTTSCQRPDYVLSATISNVNYIFFGSKSDPFNSEDVDGPGVDLQNLRIKWNRTDVSVNVIRIKFTFFKVPPENNDYECELEEDDIAFYFNVNNPSSTLTGNEGDDGLPSSPFSIYCVGLDLGDDPAAFVTTGEVEVFGVYYLNGQPRTTKGYKRFSIQNLD